VKLLTRFNSATSISEIDGSEAGRSPFLHSSIGTAFPDKVILAEMQQHSKWRFSPVDGDSRTRTLKLTFRYSLTRTSGTILKKSSRCDWDSRGSHILNLNYRIRFVRRRWDEQAFSGTFPGRLPVKLKGRTDHI
jgi:hypothetical protein